MLVGSSAGGSAARLTQGSFSMPLSRRFTIADPCPAAGLSITAIAACKADSSGRRNRVVVGKQLVKRLCRRFPIKCLSGPGVEGGCHGCNLLGAGHAEIGAFWEGLP